MGCPRVEMSPRAWGFRARAWQGVLLMLFFCALGDFATTAGASHSHYNRKLTTGVACSACDDTSTAAQTCSSLSNATLTAVRTLLLSSCTNSALLLSSSNCCASPYIDSAMACIWYGWVSSHLPVQDELMKLAGMLPCPPPPQLLSPDAEAGINPDRDQPCFAHSSRSNPHRTWQIPPPPSHPAWRLLQ